MYPKPPPPHKTARVSAAVSERLERPSFTVMYKIKNDDVVEQRKNAASAFFHERHDGEQGWIITEKTPEGYVGCWVSVRCGHNTRRAASGSRNVTSQTRTQACQPLLPPSVSLAWESWAHRWCGRVFSRSHQKILSFFFSVPCSSSKALHKVKVPSTRLAVLQATSSQYT